MRLKPMSSLTLKFPERIGDLIPKNEVTLCSGLPGCGKSFTILKFLNSVGVKPILFNLDQDATLQTFLLKGATVSKEALSNFVEGKYTDLENEVVVIDTYQIVSEMLDIHDTASKEDFTTKLIDVARNSKVTIIIIGHPEDYVGKSSVFKDNPSLVRNAYEHIHIDKTVDARKKDSKPEYRTYINKGRGIGGATVIQNWMRE